MAYPREALEKRVHSAGLKFGAVIIRELVMLAGCASVFLFVSPTVAADLSCNCEYQRCIDVSEKKSEDGWLRQEIELSGIVATKTAEHPAKGDFDATILVLDESVCFHGMVASLGDGPELRQVNQPNVTYIQLLGKLDRLPTAGRDVELRGTFVQPHTAWHSSDVLLDVTSIQSEPPNQSN